MRTQAENSSIGCHAGTVLGTTCSANNRRTRYCKTLTFQLQATVLPPQHSSAKCSCNLLYTNLSQRSFITHSWVEDQKKKQIKKNTRIFKKILPISSKFSGRLGLFFFDLEIFFLDPPRLAEIKLLESIKKNYSVFFPLFPFSFLRSSLPPSFLPSFLCSFLPSFRAWN